MQPSPKYNGDPTAQALAHGLATLGRYGDDYMVHASEGETVIPREILDANPQLKQDLFRQMIMMGIQDPNRYVVGSALNSLNPITGQPEFFFKKLWKAAKKIFKKAAPIIAPILGNMILPGIGGIIASALTTKLMGGSWGDALKAGALSWGTQGLMGGIGGLAEGGGGFMSGLGEGLSAPFTAAGNLLSGGAQNPLAQGIFGPKGTGTFFSGLADTDFAKQGMDFLPQYQGEEALMASGTSPVTGLPVSRATPGAYNMPIPQAGAVPVAGPSAAQIAAVRAESPFQADAMQLPASGEMDAATFQNTMEVSEYDALNRPTRYTSRITGDTMGPERYNATLAELKGTRFEPIHHPSTQKPYTKPDWEVEHLWNKPKPQPDDIFTSPEHAWEAGVTDDITLMHKGDPTKGTSDIYGVAPLKEGSVVSPVAPEVPWYKSKEVWGPAISATVPSGLAYWAAKREEDKGEDEVKKLSSTNPKRIAYEEWEKIKDKSSPEARRLRLIWYGQPKYDKSQLATMFGATGQGAPAGARGGEVVGRGTGTSDSIPARLSDGEFVMTADAVRNAGNGNRDLGAARMYDMMSRFERRG